MLESGGLGGRACDIVVGWESVNIGRFFFGRKVKVSHHYHVNGGSEKKGGEAKGVVVSSHRRACGSKAVTSAGVYAPQSGMGERMARVWVPNQLSGRTDSSADPVWMRAGG